MQGALAGSFFIHALLFYGLSLTGGNPPAPSPTTPSVLRVELVSVPPPAEPSPEPAPEPTLAPTPTEPAEQPVPKDTPAPEAKPSVAVNDGIQAVPWIPSDPKVQKLQELDFPPDTSNMTATLEIEVTLDKEGKPLTVKVLKESPKAIFTEWAWEMGMKGLYSPKMTVNGPVESSLVIRLDIAPGAPLAIN